MFRAQVLIVRRPKLYYRVYGIITPIDGRPVHRLRESSLNLCTGYNALCYNVPYLLLFLCIYSLA